MKIRTQALTLLQLDYAVAKANGDESRLLFEGDSDQGITGMRFDPHHAKWSPSTQWDQAGPIIDREDIHWGFGTKDGNKVVIASKFGHHVKPLLGPTPLIAAMRCFVASRLGDKVEIPEELCK
jgi:hypothetical protein